MEIAVSIYILFGQVPPLPVPPLTEEVSDDTPPVDLQFNRFSRRL